MALKNNCPTLKKVYDDEPIFVLRAQDQFAPILVNLWAQMLKLCDSNRPKIREALECAAAMEDWAKVFGSKIPD
jgi:hypothetical protein